MPRQATRTGLQASINGEGRHGYQPRPSAPHRSRVANPDERMGIGQGGGCLACPEPRGGQGVSMAGQAWAAAGAELARAAGPQRRAAQGTPCPPPLGVCERGPRPNFLHFFDDNVFKENVNGH